MTWCCKHEIDNSRWNILDYIGSGYYGCVTRAYDIKLKLDVAIKCGRISPTEVELQSAAANMKISPAIVAYGNTNYFVMDYIPGTRLVNYEITPQIRDDLGCIGVILDKLGIHHADLHPGNIIIDNTGKPIVVDYGLAKYVSDKDMKLNTKYLELRYNIKQQINYVACAKRYNKDFY